MISYERLFHRLKEENISQYALIHTYNVSPAQITRLKRNQYVSTHTIDVFCRILHCKVEDVMEYIPETERDSGEMNVAEGMSDLGALYTGKETPDSGALDTGKEMLDPGALDTGKEMLDSGALDSGNLYAHEENPESGEMDFDLKKRNLAGSDMNVQPDQNNVGDLSKITNSEITDSDITASTVHASSINHSRVLGSRVSHSRINGRTLKGANPQNTPEP